MNRFSPAVLYLSLLLSSAQLSAADTTAQAAPSGPTPAQVLAARTAKIECPAFQKIATDYQAKFLAPMQTWSGQHLSKLGTKKLTYVFSGADIVTPLTLFSTADHFTLIAAQTPEYTLPQEI